MIKRFLIPILITNIPVLIPVIVEPEKYRDAKFLLVYMAFLLFTMVYFYCSDFESFMKLKKSQVSLLLDKIFLEIESKINKKGNIPIRIYIMKPKFNLNPFLGKRIFLKKCFLIEYHYNMKDAADLNNAIPIDVGVEGNAFKNKRITVGDFRNLFKNGYANWGYSSIDLQILKNLKSKISVPIKDFSNESKIIGVLNIDSARILEKTPFQQEEFRDFLKSEAKVIAPFIK